MITGAPQPGEKTPLNHTKKARERIIAGLSWDARETKVGMLDGLLKKDSQHDLDITCYIYNAQKEFIDFVGAEAQDSMDESGKIYHSGDDMSGAGEGDDETISLELAELPEETHGIVFLVEIRSNHLFSEIDAPFVRLADGMTNENLLETPLIHDEAVHKNAFVMCSIWRNDESPTGWMLQNISDYPDTAQIEDWGSYLTQFVD